MIQETNIDKLGKDIERIGQELGDTLCLSQMDTHTTVRNDEQQLLRIGLECRVNSESDIIGGYIFPTTDI